MGTLSKLIEVSPFEYKIVEDQDSKRPGVLLALEGIFQRAGKENANKRIYPESLWQKIMTDEDVNDRLSTRRMVGELDHPANGSTSTAQVSHVVTEHKLMSDGVIRGRLEILDTPAGRIAETLLKAGVQLGISSRGDGSVERKGDVSEVQDDFRLETYDLVLKPSTPGAFPQIVESEEAAQKNNALIADAVEGLVKSTSDLEVLLECHKIISVLEAGPRCEAILKELKSKFRMATINPTGDEETLMSDKTRTSPELSPETTLFLKEQVDRGIAEAVRTKDGKIIELNEMLVQTTKEKETLGRKVEAAEKLIDEFQRQTKDLKEQIVGDKELSKKYEAAVKIIDEAVKRLKMLGETQRRLAASNALLATSIARHRNEAVARKVNSLIGNLDEKVQAKLRPMLMECMTARQVKQRFTELASLVRLSKKGAQPQRGGALPTRENRRPRPASLTESKSTKHNDPVTNRLLQRLSGVAQ